MNRSTRTSLASAVTLILLALAVFSGAPAMAAEIPEGARLGVDEDTVRIPGDCEKLREDGVEATVLEAVVTRFSKPNGSFDFSLLDPVVDAAISCGIEPSFRVFAQPANSEDRGLPDNLDVYRTAVLALADHFKGRVKRYGVENEVISTSHWTDTPAQYFQLLGIAGAAIHQANPGAIVLDSVSSSGGFSIIEARKKLAAGDLDSALAIIQESQDNDLGGGARLTSTSQVEPYLTTSKVVKMQQFYDGLVANKGLIDALQLHYYGPSGSLPATIAMVRGDGLDMPIEIWELGRRYLEGRPFEQTGHADETTKLLATAVGEGSRWNILQRYYDKPENDMYGLIDPSGVPRLARSAFRTSVAKLSGTTSAKSLSLPGAHGYGFSRPEGQRMVVWTDSATLPVGQRLGINATTAAVTDNLGTATSHLALKGLEATGSPLWIEPDLPVVKLQKPAKKGTLRVRLECPIGSGSKFCAGKVTVKGGRGNRTVIGSRKYKISRGVTRSVEMRRNRTKSKGRIVLAIPFKCPGGLKACRSWKSLR